MTDGEVARASRRRLVAGGAVACVLLALLLASGSCVHTAPFTDARGRVVPGSVATMERPIIGGVEQSLWLRGASASNPPLVLLHGGPGASESALFRHFDAELEEHFLVVYWEQRGAGRSFHSGIAPESMTIGRMVGDLDEVVDLVRRRFGQDEVVLLGHSWGTVLGTIYAAEHPEKVSAYVAVAPVVNTHRQRRLAYDFTLEEARRRGHARAISKLEAIGPPPYASVDEALAVERWTGRFGGIFHGDLSTGRLIWSALRTDEANLVDLVEFGRGNRFSLIHLEDEISELDLGSRHLSFEVPVFFLLGRHDRHVSATLAAEYFEKIAAPCKRLVWFEESAHNPPFEEPGRFVRTLVEEVRPVVLGEARCAR
jgi:proline iminopeptidase